MYILVANSDAFFGSDSDRFLIYSYVCARCGYMELYVGDPGETGKPRQAWLTQSQTKEWVRVTGSDT